jgi:hypothetical protein
VTPPDSETHPESAQPADAGAPPDPASAAKRGEASRPGQSSIARWIAVAAATLLALFLVFEIAIAPQSATCGVCHDSSPHAAMDVTHADVACSGCHTRGGLSGWLDARAAELTIMYPATILGERGVAPQVTSETCVECHGEEIERILTVDNISVRHETCAAEGAWCTDCHSTAGHGEATARVRYPTMDRCVGCHDGADAPDECDVCHSGQREERHTDAGVWAVTHGENWESTHGMGALGSCRVCHPTDDCGRCHYQQPHPDDWPARHGGAALAEESVEESCLDCHVQSYCDSCHGLEMPHPPYWRPQHMEEAEDMRDEACLVCHSAADCSDCHVAHTHPGRIDPGKRP